MTGYIIVGAGPAGCAMAARLSEDPDVTVTLLEAGGSDRHPLIHIPAGFARMTKGIASWGWSTVPQKHLNGRVLWYTQARVLGGGSSINAQIYTRGHPADYDGWANDGCEGWSYREALPYFMRAEDNQRFDDDYHARGGPLGVSDPPAPLPICEAWFEAAGALGIPFNPDFNGVRQEGVGHYQLTQRNARRSSAATAYLGPIRRPAKSLGAYGRPGAARPRRRGPGNRRGESPPGEASRRSAPTARSSSPAAPSDHRCCCCDSGIGPAEHLSAHGRSRESTTCQASARTCTITSTSSPSANARATTPTTPMRRCTRRPGRGSGTPSSATGRRHRVCSRPAASGASGRTRVGRTCSFTSASVRESRPASSSSRVPG